MGTPIPAIVVSEGRETFTPLDQDMDLLDMPIEFKRLTPPPPVVCIDDSAALADAECIERCRNTYQFHPLMRKAQEQMVREMAAFPWKSLTPLEAAQEQDAEAAGFRTSRQANEEQVRHVHEEMVRLLASGTLFNEKRAVVLAIHADGTPRPRTKGLVLALQALINEYALPAFILDSEEDGHRDGDGESYTRHTAELAVIWPR